MKFDPSLVRYLKIIAVKLRLRAEGGGIENINIVRGMVWVSFFLFFAKIIGAAKEIIIANRYGTSPELDGYLFVFNLAQWPSSVFASVTAMTLIPYLVRLQKDKPDEAKNLQAALISFSLLLGVAASVFYCVIIWWIIGRFSLGLSDQSEAAILTALPWVAPGIALAFIGSVLSNWLMSQFRHTNTLLEAAPAGVIAVSLLIWPIAAGQAWTVWPLAVGTFLGVSLQTLLLIRAGKEGFRLARPSNMSQHWSVLRSTVGIMVLAQVIMTSTGLLNQFFAVRMGEGVLASYSYAERLMALLLGLTSTVISRSMLPILAGIDDRRVSFELTLIWAWRLTGLGVVVVLGLYFIAELLVTLLFQRGAFTASDSRGVAEILVTLGIQMPFYLSSIVLVQWLSASGNTSWLLLVAVGGLAAKILGVILWFDRGAVGLALSTSFMYAITTILTYIIARFLIKNYRVSR